MQVRSDAVTVAGPLLLTSVNARHQVTCCSTPCVVVLDVVDSNRSLASLAPVTSRSNEVQHLCQVAGLASSVAAAEEEIADTLGEGRGAPASRQR